MDTAIKDTAFSYLLVDEKLLIGQYCFQMCRFVVVSHSIIEVCMKKLFSLMLVFGMLAVGIGACGDTGTTPDSAPSPAPETSPSP